MPYSITTKDGITIQNIPDEIPADSPELKARVEKIRGSKPEATLTQKVQASVPGRVLQGARDPIDAGAQILPRGLSALTSGFGLVENPVSRFFDSEAKRVDQINQRNEADYEASRKATGQDGFDAARLVGNVVSPANAAIAARLPAATTGMGRAAQGVGVGAAGGALTPVNDPNADFASTKAAQVGLGAATGGVLTPALGAVADKVVKAFTKPKAQPINLSEVDRTVRQIVSESGTKWEDLAPQVQGELRAQAVKALENSNRRLDPAAVLRQQDFAREGMQGTSGQITRDAGQFSKERNLRTMPGVGDELLQRFELQGQQLQDKVGKYSQGASSEVSAGERLAAALRAKDEELRRGVSSAYQTARQAAGKDAEVPMGGLASDYAAVLDSFGDKVPSGVRNQFAKFGLDPSVVTNQKKLFTVEEADKLLKVINDNQSSDSAVNSALSALRGAVKKSVTDDAGVDDVFAPARKAAAERFRMQEAVPALEAASKGSVAPDDFVRKYVINGKARDVEGMAKILKESSPQAYQEARAQIGTTLQRAAFGENVAGDKAFAAERYAKALRDLGPEKLRAFFTTEEIAQMERLKRLGAYINSMPNASPVQTSNNWGALMNIASRIPGVPSAVGVINSVKNTVENQGTVNRALSGAIPQKPTELSPEQVRRLGYLLSAGGLASGQATAEQLK